MRCSLIARRDLARRGRGQVMRRRGRGGGARPARWALELGKEGISTTDLGSVVCGALRSVWGRAVTAARRLRTNSVPVTSG